MCLRCICPYCAAPSPVLMAAIGTKEWGIEDLVCENCEAYFQQTFMQPAARN